MEDPLTDVGGRALVSSGNVRVSAHATFTNTVVWSPEGDRVPGQIHTPAIPSL